MSARLKRRSRTAVILVVVASRLRLPTLFTLSVSTRPRRGTSPTSTVATPLLPCRNERELRQLRDCVIRPRCHRRVARGGIRRILTADK